ncbi:LacI family DNA-binding transcriptional regulator [Bifidobacterium sp. ESL0798]|uniref:LacI family DNA-binding transcriptional regulator n=1 Tax=Bifidobacterium sp. ESL0798 TaxID=2983235 RepID=UPI0023F84B39|nr:LacI family DNA-binding transcriptional regulator [Bifidobacterium sp. ESL0798]WEV74186.1 LacI family DNA-binding transcriptional regulator [Bifidobacterium sp. ESL0798]
MNRKVTLKDIAHAADVSITAVSLVLNGRPTRMTEEKRQLILDTAKRLNYIPNQAARSLATNRSMLLALLVPDIENMFFASLAKALEDVSSEDGYSLLIANSDDSQQTELRLLNQFASRGVDGLFLIPSRESTEDSTVLRTTVSHLDFPVILTDRLVSEGWCDAVGSDNFNGGMLAAKTLVSQGHVRIGCISGGERSDNTDKRMAGFTEGLRQAGISLDPALRRKGNYRFDGGYQQADSLIDANVTAVFCGNDLMAMGFMQRLSERGLRCPEDCSVIGYDNVSERFGFDTQLTTVDQNIEAVAQACHDCLTHRLHQTNNRISIRPWLGTPERRFIEPVLIDRLTVTCPHS